MRGNAAFPLIAQLRRAAHLFVQGWIDQMQRLTMLGDFVTKPRLGKAQPPLRRQ